MIIMENYDIKKVSEDFKKDRNCLSGIYKEIADEIGIECALAIYKLYSGTQISFSSRLYSKNYIHCAVRDEYEKGKSIQSLSRKYNYSTRTIWRILKKRDFKSNR